MRYGYRNVSGAVEMVLTFVPGGCEELFVRSWTDTDLPAAGAGFVEDARRLFAVSFE